MQKTDISGFILAGGKSSRFGQDKVFLPWNRGTLLDHATDRLSQVCAAVQICSSRELRSQATDNKTLPAIPDALPNAGPLAGIVSALENSPTEWNFFLAVDLPLVPINLLQALVLHLQNDQNLALVPQLDGMPQPLCALYHRSLAPGLRRALEGGKYKIMLAVREALQGIENSAHPSRLQLFNVRDCVSKTASNLSPEEWLLNINTPAEWQKARELNSHL